MIIIKNMAKIMTISVSIMFIVAFVGQSTAEAYYVGSTYDYNQNYGYNYNYSTSNLTASCYADPVSAPMYSNVTWQVNANGGNGYYTYRWDGTDSLSGSARVINASYNNIGRKYASITVTSGNQTIHETCINYVDVGPQNYNTVYNQNYIPVYDNNYYSNPNYNYNNNYPYYYNSYGQNYNLPYNYYLNGFQVSCYPDKANAEIGDTVRWNSSVQGGNGNYMYSWTGTNGLSSNQSTVITSYNSAGTKSATLTVTNSDGQMMTQACSGSVDIADEKVVDEPTTRTITVPVVVYPNNNVNNQNQPQNIQGQNYNQQSANSMFSLSNVPWGWVAVLVILILMFTAMYLTFTKTKN